MASEEQRERLRKATLVGLSWGLLGHGTTMVLVGLPLVLLGRCLPEGPDGRGGRRRRHRRAARRPACSSAGAAAPTPTPHAHEGGEEHLHLHSHALHRSHEHTHDATLRTRLSAYGVGLVHGIGGSGGLTLLLLSTVCDPAETTAALFVFALGTALCMALLSTAFGLVIAAGPVARRFERVAPVLSVLGTLGMVVYPF